MSDSVQTVTMDWADVRDRFLQARADKGWPSQPTLNACVAEDWTKPAAARWTGGTGEDTERWLRDGFHAETFKLNQLDIVPRQRPRASWTEDDGDIDPGRLYGGQDDFYLAQAERESMPGVTLQFEYDFGAQALPEAIEQYGQWLARIVASLEAEGYDIGAEVILRTMDLLKGTEYRDRVDVRIILKQPGTVSDFTTWSALFAPTGFRHLCFTALGLAADALGKRAARGLGGPVTSGWKVRKDKETILIGCDSRAGQTFPLEQMTNEARKAGIIR